MLNKRNTRDEILKKAFVLCKNSNNANFSLSVLAREVGISKPAIFRHFKNKDALFEEMKNIFFRKIGERLSGKEYFFSRQNSNYEFDEFEEVINVILDFFMEHPEYLCYVHSSKCFKKRASGEIVDELEKNGVIFSDEFKNKKSPERFLKVYYCIGSMMYFLSRRMMLEKYKPELVEPEDVFKKNVIYILWNGIGRKEISISKERIAALDAISEVRDCGNGEDTRFFKAFSEVFSENGIEGITIEKISEKLNLAKSSLYSFFDNKDEFISKMLGQEIDLIYRVINERVKAAENNDEMIYILLRTEKNYLEERPFVLMIHYWASKNGLNFEEGKDGGKKILPFELEMPEEINFGIEISKKNFLGWVSSLTGTLAIFLQMPELSDIGKKIDYVDRLFKYIECGIH